MRIISGRWGGRRLVTPKHWRTRPTPDRVKEALFSILGDLEGANVLDAYAGSGALALEALSRGAARADLVDRDSAAIEAIRHNVEGLGADARVLRGDPLRLLARGTLAGPYDLVFLDPPYERQLWGPALSALDSAGVLSESARVVNEHPSGFELTAENWQIPPRFAIETQRSYGDVAITVLVSEGEPR